jgi:solute carrier family 25 folate transporter 32
LLTVPLFWGVYFPLYDETKHYLQTQNENTSKVLINYHPGVVHCISAIFTGAVADLICNPLFVVRTRLQTQALHELNSSTSTTATRPTSMIQMANELRTKHGVTVFWRGMTANIMGLSHCAVQFPAYEFLKSYLREQRHNNNIINNSNNSGNINLISSDSDNNMINDNTVGELLIASGMAKMTASLLTYPHEVLRSRMMDDRSSTAPTLRGTAKHIYMKEGIKGYYNGLSVTLLRVVPNCCVTFLSYELILKYSKDYFGNNKI